jgi:hypothetical protein
MAVSSGRLFLVGVLAVGIAGGVLAYRRTQLSPFEFRDFRAGATFSSLDGRALRETGGSYSCAPVEQPGAGSVCKLVMTRASGTMSLLVDSSRRAIVVRFETPDVGLNMQRELRNVADRWRNVSIDRRLGYPASDGLQFEAMHWLTRDGRWSATIQTRRDVDPLIAFTIRDEEALSRLVSRSPLARLHYDSERLINPLTSQERFHLASRAMREGGVSPSGAAEGDTAAPAIQSEEVAREALRLAENSRSLPECRATAADTVGKSPASYRAAISDSAMTNAVEFGFPGSRLELKSGPYFILPNGRPELVQLTETLVDPTRRVAVFGVTFLRRMEQIGASGDPSCRAPARLIVARLAEGGVVDDAAAVVLSPDAISSRIRDIQWKRDESGRQLVKVTLVSRYATSQWLGEIDWEEMVSAEDRLSHGRTPVRAARKDVRGTERRGDVRTTPDSANTLRVVVQGVEDGSRPYEQKLLLPRDGGYVSGWKLLLGM